MLENGSKPSKTRKRAGHVEKQLSATSRAKKCASFCDFAAASKSLSILSFAICGSIFMPSFARLKS